MYVATHAKNTPDKVAYVMGGTGESVTYRQLDDRSNQLAQLLYDRGLRPGDAIAICMENHPRYFEATWAGQRSGLTTRQPAHGSPPRSSSTSSTTAAPGP